MLRCLADVRHTPHTHMLPRAQQNPSLSVSHEWIEVLIQHRVHNMSHPQTHKKLNNLSVKMKQNRFPHNSNSMLQHSTYTRLSTVS